jgi:hypothetical protein
VPVVPLVAFCGLAWVAEHIVEVAIVSAVSGALAVAAVVALMRWTERREGRHAAARPLLIAREAPAAVAPAARPAITGGLHLHLDGMPSSRQAAGIREALEGRDM